MSDMRSKFETMADVATQDSFYRDEQFDSLSVRWAEAIIAKERGAAKHKNVAAEFEAICSYLDSRFAAAYQAGAASVQGGQEPVAYRDRITGMTYPSLEAAQKHARNPEAIEGLYAAPLPREQEPVAYLLEWKNGCRHTLSFVKPPATIDWAPDLVATPLHKHAAPLPQGEQCPNGYFLVPIELTPEIEAIYRNDKGAYDSAEDLHAALINAAPADPAQPVPDNRAAPAKPTIYQD